MIGTLLLSLTGCMIEPDNTKPADDGSTETTEEESTGSESDSSSTDADGDGVTADADCDDNNPWVTEGCGRTCTGDFVVETNADFANVAGCAIIEGDLDIDGIDQTDLTGLNSLEQVTGALWVMYNPTLQTLDGLNNLLSVGDGLLISYNDALVDISGLESLQYVDGTLSISNSHSLTDIQGINNLSYIGSSLMLNNIGVSDLNAFDKVESIGGSIYISDCEDLTSLMGLTVSLASFGEGEEIGTYDEDGYMITSLFYVYNNEWLCQTDVDQVTTIFENMGWTGTANSWNNNGCN